MIMKQVTKRDLASVTRSLSIVEKEYLKHHINAARGCGQPLDEDVLQNLEASFGLDLSAVRVHTGSTASTLAHTLGADAFTCGTDIFFAADAYRPESKAGKWLLAHEITHVVQQARGVVYDQRAVHGVVMGEPDDRWEEQANDVASSIVEGRSVQVASGLASVATASSFGYAARPMIIQCHDSFEHRVLGDVSTGDLYAISTNGLLFDEVMRIVRGGKC